MAVSPKDVKSRTASFLGIALPQSRSASLMTVMGIDKAEVPWWTSARFGLSVLCFWGFACLYAQRVNLSIAIVSMVPHHHHSENSTVTIDPRCMHAQKAETMEAEFVWSKELQGLILGAFFWGYLVLQVPGGWLAERYGAKKVVALSMFPVAILNILSPFAARFSPFLFIVVRIFVGLGEGTMYPAAQALWSNWAPPQERSRLIGIAYAGGQFGNALIFPLGGFLAEEGFDNGWASIFYVIGGLGFIWCCFWVIFAFDRPDKSPRISDIERQYIDFYIMRRRSLSDESWKTPWMSLATSKPVWAILIIHTCGNYGIYMLLTQIPTYMKEVLNFDMKANGLYSMLPYLNFWLITIIGSNLADALIEYELLSVSKARKMNSTIGTVGPAIFLVATGFMECYQWPGAVALLTMAVGLCGFQFSGYFINHGDIAPHHAGTLFGITNTAATVPGILAPYVVAAMTKDRTREQWSGAFFVAAGIYLFGALVYNILGSGDVQDWALPPGPKEEQEDQMVVSAIPISITAPAAD